MVFFSQIILRSNWLTSDKQGQSSLLFADLGAFEYANVEGEHCVQFPLKAFDINMEHFLPRPSLLQVSVPWCTL
jgi:hypothetical protein